VDDHRGVHRKTLGDSNSYAGVNAEDKQLVYGGWLEDLIRRVEHDEPSAWQEGLKRYFKALSYRLEKVDLLCGYWKRAVSEGILNRARGTNKITAIMFDPPYDPRTCESKQIYAHCDEDVARDVEIWCRVHEWQPKLRICLAAYAGSVALPAWAEYKWSNAGGAHGRRDQERLYFSPHCLP
jgi:hypothetical protein